MTYPTSDVFPRPKTDVLSMYIKAGIMLTPCVGSTTIPAKRGFQLTPYDNSFDPIEENYQALLMRRVVVIDVDPQNYRKSEDGECDRPLKRLFADLDINLNSLIENTFVVKTPTGGYHIYLTKVETLKIKQHIKAYPGLEFKDRWITAAGSYRRMPKKKDGYYEIYRNDPSIMISCPNNLLALLTREEEVQIDVEGLVTDHPAKVKQFINFCQECEPAIEGRNGDNRTFMVASVGKDWALRQETTFEIMMMHFNPRCHPQWSEVDIQQKVENAYAFGYRPVGSQGIDQEFNEPLQEVVTQDVKWQLTEGGMPKKTRNNLANMLFKVDGAPCHKMFQYNEFTHEIELMKRPVWHKDGAHWSDSDATQAACWLSYHKSYEVQTGMIHEVVLNEARTRSYHPIRNYLSNLPPAKDTLLLDNWLTTYCGVPSNQYSQYVGRKILIAAVARVFKPGCKFDHVLVLEGKQDLGKSMLCRTLAEPWFTDANLDIRDKDAVAIMQGKWIVELGEMSVLNQPGIENLKAFITRQIDRMRPSYGRTVEDFKRQCIFIGTINPEKQGYLKDPTGNRRFWPVSLKFVDLAKLKEDRDALWAQAYKAYKTGEIIYVHDKKTAHMINNEIVKRQQEDPWFELIENHIEGNYMSYCPLGSEYCVILPAQMYEDALNGTSARVTSTDASRIANILVRLGFEKTGSNRNKRSSQYVKLFESFL